MNYEILPNTDIQNCQLKYLFLSFKRQDPFKDVAERRNNNPFVDDAAHTSMIVCETSDRCVIAREHPSSGMPDHQQLILHPSFHPHGHLDNNLYCVWYIYTNIWSKLS